MPGACGAPASRTHRARLCRRVPRSARRSSTQRLRCTPLRCRRLSGYPRAPSSAKAPSMQLRRTRVLDGRGVDVESHVQAAVVGQQGQVERDPAEGPDGIVRHDLGAPDVAGEIGPAHVRSGEVDGLGLGLGQPDDERCRQRGRHRRDGLQPGGGRCLPGRGGRLVDQPEALGHVHLPGGDQHPDQREGVGAGLPGAGADGHRGTELLHRGAHLLVVLAWPQPRRHR